MPDPKDQGFELNGVLFGEAGSVLVESFSPGSDEWRTQDAAQVMGDARYFGRDFKSASTWTWNLGTNMRDEAGAMAVLEAVEAAWDREEVRSEPGAVCALRYRINGRTRRVYGRPRNCVPILDVRRFSGYIPITADFTRSDPLHYDDEEQSVALTMVAGSTGGLMSPLISPLTSVNDESKLGRDGQITVGGNSPTSVVIEIDGQVTRPYVKVEGLWTVTLETSIAGGDTVTLDGKPWVLSATRKNGGSVAGAIRGVRLSQLVLPPGEHQLTFGGQSSAGGARATVRWRAASKTL